MTGFAAGFDMRMDGEELWMMSESSSRWWLRLLKWRVLGWRRQARERFVEFNLKLHFDHEFELLSLHK